ncbi:hypothetical protein [Leptospira meyeri]|uniref:hypothetical protein n=1 Tax=Leptospira meyeri TaxID=29508 RepID=UPI000C29B1BD|nr:hypothetical protein [Leptospira meyeri]MCW7488790.1 hypothetical protein [Leptospira meyeri]PJZ81056.1 hypothetical protein CH359_08185 [Leptospira meyeri]PJZ96560.1 hypothetical protein CH358_09855 [Leptospira meyeri]
MKKQIIIFLLFLIVTSLIANPESKAKDLCDCLKNGKTSQNESNKKECLTLRETHVSTLKKGSKSYDLYLSYIQKCEQEFAGTKEINTNLTTQEKVSAVCDCFQKEGKQNRMSCFKLQSDYGKSIIDPEEKKEFNLSSGSCDK